MIDVKTIDRIADDLDRQYQMNVAGLIGEVVKRLDHNIIHQGFYSTWLKSVTSWRFNASKILDKTIREGFMLIHSGLADLELDEDLVQRLRGDLEDSYFETAQRIGAYVANDAAGVQKEMRAIRLRVGMGGQHSISALLGAKSHWGALSALTQTDSINRRYRSNDLARRALRGALMETYVETKIAALHALGYDRVRVFDTRDSQDTSVIPLADVHGGLIHQMSHMDFEGTK